VDELNPKSKFWIFLASTAAILAAVNGLLAARFKPFREALYVYLYGLISEYGLHVRLPPDEWAGPLSIWIECGGFTLIFLWLAAKVSSWRFSRAIGALLIFSIIYCATWILLLMYLSYCLSVSPVPL
jgi:hypothetical protein